jgi:hypothetical protein
MKKLFLIPLALLATSASLMAQLKVATNGNVGIGTTTPNAPLSFGTQINLSIIRLWDGPGYDWYGFGIYPYELAMRVGGDYSSQFKFRNRDNSVVAAVTASGDIWQNNSYARNYWTNSDKRIKQNIVSCNNALSKVLALRGVKYDLKDSVDAFYLGDGMGDEKTDTTKTNKKNPQKLKALGKNAPSKTNYGFIAQEVEKIVPEIVSINKAGSKLVNYQGIIPLLVEALKEQNSVIDVLKVQNLKLAARIAKLEKGKTSTSNARTEADTQDTQTDTKASSNVSDLVKTAYLYQNTPNPFSQETQIRYYVPETNANTFVSVTDLSGKQIKLLPITTQGEGFVSIKANELYAGLFIYTLVVDGNIIDSKRMMVVE